MKTATVKLVPSKGGRPPSRVPVVPIDKGVPMPSVSPGIQFPFAEMEVGDSFFVEARLDATSAMARIRAKHRYWLMGQCPRPAMRIAIRKVDGGVRCWRVL